MKLELLPARRVDATAVKLGAPESVAFVFRCVPEQRDPAQRSPGCGTFAVYRHTSFPWHSGTTQRLASCLLSPHWQPGSIWSLVDCQSGGGEPMLWALSASATTQGGNRSQQLRLARWCTLCMIASGSNRSRNQAPAAVCLYFRVRRFVCFATSSAGGKFISHVFQNVERSDFDRLGPFWTVSRPFPSP